jgi:hypothetical protein
MHGSTFAIESILVLYLLDGADARVVGGEELRSQHRIVYVDDLEADLIETVRTAAPGVRVEQDGKVVLFATPDRDAAARLLERALAEVESIVA